ncbi:MAG: hypothetical protein H7338_02615 [Candidatus Sericytochromatia bacterium]|nr:hypothetical protein [Candidatus Sericytochromatia bacterium]
MSQRPLRFLPALLLAAVALPLWGLPARSYSPYLDQVRAMYPYDFSCNVCHGADHKLNTFGTDFADAMTRSKDPYLALQAVEMLDSDNDGVSNGEELLAGTLPEDRFSRVGGFKGGPGLDMAVPEARASQAPISPHPAVAQPTPEGLVSPSPAATR